MGVRGEGVCEGEVVCVSECEINGEQINAGILLQNL